MNTIENTERILAIYPTTKGFAFLISEGEDLVVDFGNVTSKDIPYLHNKFSALVDDYYIDRVITEEFDKQSQRKDKAKDLILECKEIINHTHIKISSYSKKQIDEAFTPYGAFTKYNRALAVVQALPHMNHILPEKRKI